MFSKEKKAELIALVVKAHAQAREEEIQEHYEPEIKKASKPIVSNAPGPLAQNRKFRDQIKNLVKSATR